jgi:LacI family transcriptional regulator
LSSQGVSAREIGRRLGIHYRTVANWTNTKNRTVSEEPSLTEGPISVAPGKRRPTIDDVAKKARVSISTISNYLNNKGRMSRATSSRIESAIDELHFTPSFLLRAMRQNRTRIIGVVIFGLGSLDEKPGESLTPALLTGIDTAAQAAAQDVLLYTDWGGPQGSISPDRFLGGHIDGLVWVAPQMHEPVLEKVASAGLPVVAPLTRHVPDNVGYVNVDNIAAILLLVRHLAQLGRRRIAYVGPAHTSNYLDRRDGYRLALQAEGLAWSAEIGEKRNENPWLWDHYYDGIDRLVTGKNRPDAIITADDGVAMLGIEILQKRGIRVPQEIAVTGFNDIPDARDFCGGLTTIRQDFRQIGRLGVERLVALIEGAPVEECRVTLSPELVVRATTVPL